MEALVTNTSQWQCHALSLEPANTYASVYKLLTPIFEDVLKLQVHVVLQYVADRPWLLLSGVNS
jgi:hypothetical protein